jgi:hypothetical protein
MTDESRTDGITPMGAAAAAIGSVAADLRSAASQKFSETVTEARSQADDAKANVAGEVKDMALALRRASEELRGGSAQERTLGMIATSMVDASDALRDKDMGEILQTVSKVARDHPLLFLGGATLLGFVASRYAKASADTDYPSGDSTGPAFGFASSGTTGSLYQSGIAR